MRVAEIGLRALARERRMTIRRKPLEWANWQDILRELRVKIAKIAQRRAGPSRDAALEFYRGALGEFEAFKDAYRNNVMRVRVTYDEHQALSVMNHVREFMTCLSFEDRREAEGDTLGTAVALRLGSICPNARSNAPGVSSQPSSRAVLKRSDFSFDVSFVALARRFSPLGSAGIGFAFCVDNNVVVFGVSRPARAANSILRAMVAAHSGRSVKTWRIWWPPASRYTWPSLREGGLR